MKGINKANLNEKLNWSKSFSKNDRPCIFLSHKKEDKDDCRKIAEYIEEKGIDIFFDEQDAQLQQAVKEEDPFKITERIKEAIRESSHMLIIISKKTTSSKWVPFETGYGHAALIDKTIVLKKSNISIKLAVLTLEDLSNSTLPEFLQIAFEVRGKKSFDKYLEEVNKEDKTKQKSSSENITELLEQLKMSIPLIGVLNFNL
jgi:hypothetical protein